MLNGAALPHAPRDCLPFLLVLSDGHGSPQHDSVCNIAWIVILLGSSPLLAQDLAAWKSHHLSHRQNEMSPAVAHQHVLPQPRTTLWEITLGAPLRQLPDCTEDTPLPEDSSICLSPSLPAHPPYSWMTINNAPYPSAHLALILYEGAVESVDSIIDAPWCGVVLRSLQKELGEASMYQPGSRRRERKWVWHTSPDTWVFYRMDLDETDSCILAALTDLTNGPAIPER